MILLGVQTFIEGTCPRTNAVGALLNILSVIAKLVFVILAFIFGVHWWYGLVAIAIQLFVPMITPRVDPDGPGIWSLIGSYISVALMVFVYLLFFGVV